MAAARPFINVALLVITLVINYLSQTTVFNGITTADVANRFTESLYFPANRAFSIWGVIYSFLIAFIIYQALPAQRNNAQINKVGWLFAASCVMNATWVLAFQYFLFPLSMVFMLMLLGILLTIYIRLGVGVATVSRRDKWLVHIPFSIYLGWITAATIANATYVLTDLGWDGFGINKEIWALIMLIVTGIVAAPIVLLRRDIAYGLVIVWAVGWIAGRYAGTEYQITTVTSIIVAGVIAVLVIYKVIGMLRSGGAGSSSLNTSRAAA